MITTRYLALAAAAAMIALPTTRGFAQQLPPAKPAAPVSPAAPTAPEAPDVSKLIDSLHALGQSEGRIGRQVGDYYKAKYGRHFSDSLHNSIAAQVHDALAASGIAAQASDEAAPAAASNAAMIRVAKHSAGATGQVAGSKESIAEIIDRVRHDPEAISMPPTDSFVAGGLSIGATEHRTGTVSTVNGPLDISGTIDGDAIAVDGDVVLHPGSHVRGSVFAANGVVRMDGAGGIVDGEIRSLEGVIGPGVGMTAAAATGVHASRWRDTRLALAAFGLMMMLAVGVLTFGEEQLDNVSSTLADHFGRSIWYGIVGQIAFLPALLLVIVALAITVIGALAIPFAIIGFAVLAVGAAILGFVAVAEAGGTSILRAQSQSSLTARGAQLRAIVTGVSMFGGLWILTSIVGTEFVVGTILRALVLILTIVAITAGFGAVLVWRFEMRRTGRIAKAGGGALPVRAGDAVWQTPTPVAGVAAARRPTPAGTAATPSTPMPAPPSATSRTLE
jgi:hypothetical protein